MTPTRHDLDIAIAAYWATKEEQRIAAEAVRSTAEGSAKAVRGGGHFNPIANLLARFFTDAGYPTDSIAASGKRIVLPAYFRPNKAWDLVIVHKGVLVAAIELKALGGPSYGNNYNNRVEEALGNAVDLSRANRAGLLGHERPWLGYFFLMDDSPAARQPREPRTNPEFLTAPEWPVLSYEKRFAITGRRLVDERIYDAVCFVSASSDAPKPREPEPLLDWRHFSAAIEARLTYLSKLGLP
ncbi:MAG TPA: PaeR7I family type II restriction endonuclease [Solirubrobacterales bacterium]